MNKFSGRRRVGGKGGEKERRKGREGEEEERRRGGRDEKGKHRGRPLWRDSTMAKALFIGSIAAAVLLTSLCSDVRPPYPELNPALGKYQNAMDCLPIQETWYPVYRNYESDPAFGGKEKCGRFSSLGPAENGSFPMLFEHGQSSLKVISTPVASEGYATNNLEYFQVEGENGSLLMYIAYLDCHHQQCLVFRNNYISAVVLRGADEPKASGVRSIYDCQEKHRSLLFWRDSTMARALLISTIAATALLLPWCRGASPPYPELNPALSKYQDATKCLPIQETWYTIYRNYENDPAFGGTEKCGRFTSLGPGENGSFPMLIQYGQSSV
ncbi:uncharacterized protein ISCGN_012029 [Ixodes scapularis]